MLLQKLVRGRAIQNLMFEGKERRIELIRELQEEGDAEAQAEAEAQAQAEAAAATHMAACQDATLDTLQGEVMSATLDFLSKELVRMTEHGRIAAKVAAAERTRRVREAEESGRRQAEDHMRLKQDVVYKQLQRVHAQTADTFVDAALEAAMERGEGVWWWWGVVVLTVDTWSLCLCVCLCLCLCLCLCVCLPRSLC